MSAEAIIFYSLYGIFLTVATVGHFIEWQAERKADREWAKYVREALREVVTVRDRAAFARARTLIKEMEGNEQTRG